MKMITYQLIFKRQKSQLKSDSLMINVEMQKIE